MEEIKISKELLSEVYTGKYIILGTVWIEGDNIRFRSLNNCSISNKINKYKFAYMCKEWANNLPSKKYQLYSGICHKSLEYSICSIFSGAIEQTEEIEASSEIEAIFKACQWILDNRKI